MDFQDLFEISRNSKLSYVTDEAFDISDIGQLVLEKGWVDKNLTLREEVIGMYPLENTSAIITFFISYCFNYQIYITGSNRENAPSNEMNIWSSSTLNQIFTRSSYTQIKCSKK